MQQAVAEAADQQMILVMYHRELREMTKGKSTLLYKQQYIALPATNYPLFVSYNQTYNPEHTI